MKVGSIVVLFLLIFSCKKENKYDDEDKLCQIMLQMHKDDQKYRQLDDDPFFDIMDSIQKAEGISQKEYSAFTEEKQLAFGRRARSIADRVPRKFTEKQEDSLMELQTVLDNKNTELLIDIIKERGWPNLPDCKGDKFPTITLRHSQTQYWDEIRSLITKEFKEGRMDEAKFKFVLNHINGREDFKVTEEKASTID